ncbi:hypothetical protein HK100_008842, partial [Physocladia obscura]
NQALFKLAKNKLIMLQERDCTGAAQKTQHNAMVAQFKEIHGQIYIACNISWSQWSNWILEGEAHL